VTRGAKLQANYHRGENFLRAGEKILQTARKRHKIQALHKVGAAFNDWSEAKFNTLTLDFNPDVFKLSGAGIFAVIGRFDK
jgi:hypothetical protein